MRTMGISSVKQTIDMQYLSTLKNCITGSSKAKTFYLCLIHKHSHYNMGSHSSLLSRCIKVCDEHNTSFLQFMCIDTYDARSRKSKITALSPSNGLIDSITTLLCSFNDHTRQLVKLLFFFIQECSYTYYYYNFSHHIFIFLLHTTVIIYLFYCTAIFYFFLFRLLLIDYFTCTLYVLHSSLCGGY